VAGRLKRHASIPFAVVCMAVVSTAVAQELRDPTRPPALSAIGVAGKTEQSGWILQSVLISPERRYAIINGEVVPLGGSIAGAELVAVAAERVTLRTRDGLRVVHLFPDVTRLGAAEASTRVTKPLSASEADKATKAQRSGSSGTKK
jgi:MSHA biogenesis protein MshK